MMHLPSTYSNLRAGIKQAQDLYEADYTDAYVEIALEKKGFSKQQAEWIMLSAEVENPSATLRTSVEHRKRVSLTIALVMGVGWGIILALFLFTPTTEQNIRDMEQHAPLINAKNVGICLVLFSGWSSKLCAQLLPG